MCFLIRSDQTRACKFYLGSRKCRLRDHCFGASGGFGVERNVAGQNVAAPKFEFGHIFGGSEAHWSSTCATKFCRWVQVLILVILGVCYAQYFTLIFIKELG